MTASALRRTSETAGRFAQAGALFAAGLALVLFPCRESIAQTVGEACNDVDKVFSPYHLGHADANFYICNGATLQTLMSAKASPSQLGILGNVGIGTTSPTGTGSTVLQIAGTGGGVSQYGSLALSNASNSGGNYAGSVDFYAQGTQFGKFDTIVSIGGSSGSANLEFAVLNAGTLNKVLTITGAGNASLGAANGSGNGYLSIYNSLGYGQTNNGIILGNMQTGANSNIGVNFVDYAQNNISQILSVYPGGTKTGNLTFSPELCTRQAFRAAAVFG